MFPLSRRGFRAGLALVALAFLATLTNRLSLESFGFYHDDALYLASAKALAGGEGYLAPNLPGAPPQTKYPILYPLFLSIAWRIAPQFPAVLPWAYGLNAAAGLGLCLAAAVLLRQWGASREEALALTALFALHPHTIHWCGMLLSDALFAALALGAVAAAARATQDKRLDGGIWALAVGLSWAATLTRSIGIAFVAGIALWAILQRRPRAAAAAATALVPALLGMLDRADAPVAAGLPGFERTWAYYTSYLRFWRLSIPDLTTLQAQTSVQLSETLQHPGIAVFGAPAGAFAHPLLQIAAVALAVAVVRGVVSRARRTGLHPLHCTVVFYLPITILWNYALTTRFWLPFLPLLLFGAAGEIRGVLAMVERARRGSSPERLLARAFAAGLVVLVAFAGYRHAVRTPAALGRRAAERERLHAAKREAYDWLRRSRERDGGSPAAGRSPAPVISYEDPVVYLATGLPAMRPTAFTTGWFYRQDEAAFERQLERIGDVAETLRARYWLVSDDDFDNEIGPERTRLEAARYLRGRPVVFESADGSVRIRRIAPPAPAASADVDGGTRAFE